jgi:DNA-binding PadR family transcriptional regulator
MATKKYIKGFLEDIVLHLINERGEMYGYELTKHVQQISNGAITVTEGALYPVLHKLENKGQLTSNFKDANGRLRKYYTLTKSGKASTSEAEEELQAFVAGLTQLFNLKTAK